MSPAEETLAADPFSPVCPPHWETSWVSVLTIPEKEEVSGEGESSSKFAKSPRHFPQSNNIRMYASLCVQLECALSLLVVPITKQR